MIEFGRHVYQPGNQRTLSGNNRVALVPNFGRDRVSLQQLARNHAALEMPGVVILIHLGTAWTADRIP